jgi:DNA-binding LacI/PurR family transcriptional regulator
VKATLQHIAARAGVTKATVSYALSGKPSVSEEVRARIVAIAEELGYQPDITARSLSTGRAPTLALMVESIANPFYPEFALEIERAARARGHFLLIGNTDSDPDVGRAFLDRIAGRLSQGIVAMAGSLHVDDLRRVAARGTPVVLCLWEDVDHPPGTPCVTVDFGRAADLAAGHALALGHRRIGLLVAGGAHAMPHARRLEGFRKALGRVGVRPAAVEVARRDTVQDGRDAARRLLAADPGLSAICASNDLLALGVLQAAHELRIRVPDELSVTGITGISATKLAWPSLTTVELPVAEIARTAIDLLVDLVERGRPGDAPFEVVSTAPALIARESTAPPARAPDTQPEPNRGKRRKRSSSQRT